MGSQYTASLQRKLQEAGLQGSLDADAFITLLQYVNDVQGSLDVVYSILDVLKDGRCSCNRKQYMSMFSNQCFPSAIGSQLAVPQRQPRLLLSLQIMFPFIICTQNWTHQLACSQPD